MTDLKPCPCPCECGYYITPDGELCTYCKRGEHHGRKKRGEGMTEGLALLEESLKFLLLEDENGSRVLVRVGSIDEVWANDSGVRVTRNIEPRTLDCTTSFEEVARRLGVGVETGR